MEKEFVPYNFALRMKQLGFDEPCFGFHSPIHDLMICNTKSVNEVAGECLAPTFAQAFRWFDYKTSYSGFIVPSSNEGLFIWWIKDYEEPELDIESEENYSTREEAELACLEKLLEIVEENLINSK